MSEQLLRRAWDALDAFKQAYPENWHEDDQDVLDDLMKADLDLSKVKREWVPLTKEDIAHLGIHTTDTYPEEFIKYVEARCREKNT
jgi:ribosomal protein L7Ae-like RNA K-turn-binding protein